MKENSTSKIEIEVEYGIVSFQNKNHKPSPDFFESSNVIIFPEPSMKPNYPSLLSNYNINFRYFIIKSIQTVDNENKLKNRVVFNTIHMFDYIHKHYDYRLGINEYKYTVSSFEIDSNIPYSELQAMMEDNNDLYKKNLIKKVYNSTIDDISSQPAKDVSIGRLLRLYNTPNRENAVYNTERCGFSVVIKMTDESYLNKVLNIFNKVDYGFIRAQVMKEEYTEIEVFIYSKDKLQRELDIQRVIKFIKGYLKCCQDSFEIKRFELDHNNGALYHKFNLTGHDNEVFNLNGDNVGIIYFRFTDEYKYNLAKNVYEETTEFERAPEYGRINSPANRIIITLAATIKNGICDDDENDNYYTEINSINLLEDASYIPEKFSYIRKLLSDNVFNYRESIAYDGSVNKEFILGENLVDSEEISNYLDWFKTPLQCLLTRLCYIDHVFKSQVFYGVYLDNMHDYIKFEFTNPIRISEDKEPELTHVFFDVNLKPYVAKNIKVDPSKQTEFNNAIAKIMNSKYNPIAPNLREFEGKTACDCGGK